MDTVTVESLNMLFLSVSSPQVLTWISHAAELCMTLNLKMRGSWDLKRVILLPLLTRLMKTGMKGCFMASQASSLSIMSIF